MKKFVALILFVTLVSGITACGKNITAGNINGSETLKTVRIGTPDANGNLGDIVGIAKSKGFLDQELEKVGYKSEIFGFAAAGPAVNEALIGKSLDMAALAEFPAISAKGKGVDTKLIAITNSVSNCSIAVKTDSLYKNIEDLKGKTIAIPKGTYMQRFFILLIKEKRLNASDFKIVQMTNDMETSLISGAVDAILFTDTAINKIVYGNKTAKIIESSLDYPEFSGQSLLVGRSEYLEENPDVAIAFIKALLSARAFAKENPETADELLAREQRTTWEVIERTFHYKDTNIYENYVLKLTEQSKDKLNATKVFLLDNGFITKDFDMEDWYDGLPYEKATQD